MKYEKNTKSWRTGLNVRAHLLIGCALDNNNDGGHAVFGGNQLSPTDGRPFIKYSDTYMQGWFQAGSQPIRDVVAK